MVHANDLNPRSFHFLEENIAKNKAAPLIKAYNQDGRAFIRAMAAQKTPVHHIIMNLPASALEFLDEFSLEKDLFAYLPPDHPCPLVHVYCFSKAQDPTAEALQV